MLTVTTCAAVIFRVKASCISRSVDGNNIMMNRLEIMQFLFKKVSSDNGSVIWYSLQEIIFEGLREG